MLIARAEINRDTGLSECLDDLDRALGVFRAADNRLRLIRIYRSVGEIHSALGHALAAQEAFEAALAEAEMQIERLKPQERISYFEELNALYEAMISFQVADRDAAEMAFTYSQQARLQALRAATEPFIASLEAIGLPRPAFLGDEPLDIATATASLPAGSALLVYEVLPGQIVAWALASDRWMSFRQTISAEELHRSVVRVQEDLFDRNQMPSDSSIALFRLLIEPAMDIVRDSPVLIVVPDGPLHGLPFDALVSPHSRRFLVEDHQLALVPSTTLVRGRTKMQRGHLERPLESMLIVSNPAVDQSLYPALPTLSAGWKTAQRLARAHPNTTLLEGKSATGARFMEEAPSHKFIHFAGHALVSERHPFFSRLVFAPDIVNGDSGAVSFGHLFNLRFPDTSLVVLAACRTGLGGLPGSEGVASLAMPFLSGGVSAVVASLWEVDDRSTTEFFAAFYRHLEGGSDSGDALHRAKLEMLGRSEEWLRSPATWSAFVLIRGAASPIHEGFEST